MSPQVQVLDELTIVAPFGLRFWDVAAMAPAGAGLTVTAYPGAFPELRSIALVNKSNVYFFRDLPGMRRVESGEGDEAFWAANPPRVPFTLEVADADGRYLPYQLPVLLPAHGLFGLARSPLSSWLTPDATWLPVFPSPARETLGPSGIVRAQLWDSFADAPAAWAMMSAQAQGSAVMNGVADIRGVVTLTLPYPEPRTSPFASPLGSGPLRLDEQTWPLSVKVFYSPRPRAGGLPDLERILHQAQAVAWRDSAHSAQAGSFTLQFGKELILRSLDSSSGRQLPYLLITASSSPL